MVWYLQRTKVVEYSVLPPEQQNCLVRCGTTKTANLYRYGVVTQDEKPCSIPVPCGTNRKSYVFSTGTVWYGTTRRENLYGTVPENIFSRGGIKIRDKVPVDGFSNFGYCGMKLPKQIQFIFKNLRWVGIQFIGLPRSESQETGTGTEQVPGTTTGN